MIFQLLILRIKIVLAIIAVLLIVFILMYVLDPTSRQFTDNSIELSNVNTNKVYIYSFLHNYREQQQAVEKEIKSTLEGYLGEFDNLDDYFDAWAPYAVLLWEKGKILPSLTLIQAVIEGTDNGRYGANHYGFNIFGNRLSSTEGFTTVGEKVDIGGNRKYELFKNPNSNLLAVKNGGLFAYEPTVQSSLQRRLNLLRDTYGISEKLFGAEDISPRERLEKQWAPLCGIYSAEYTMGTLGEYKNAVEKALEYDPGGQKFKEAEQKAKSLGIVLE